MLRTILVAASAVFAMALIATVTVDARQHTTHQHTAAAKAPANTYAQKPAPANASLPPLPTVSFEPAAPMPVLQEVYAFAAHHPEVLQYIPCYCGCEQVGHQANHDCFVKSRGADGHVTQWDAHGMGCAICLGVGRRAMALFNQGMSVADIRATIDREYGSRYPSHTPTPNAPKKS